MPLLLLYGVDDCLECLRVVEGEICEHLAVQADILLCQSTDELRVVHAVLTGCGVYTLDPKRAEITFFGFTVTVCVAQTFFIGILGYGPDILPCEEVTAGLFENFLAAGS